MADVQIIKDLKDAISRLKLQFSFAKSFAGAQFDGNAYVLIEDDLCNEDYARKIVGVYSSRMNAQIAKLKYDLAKSSATCFDLVPRSNFLGDNPGSKPDYVYVVMFGNKHDSFFLNVYHTEKDAIEAAAIEARYLDWEENEAEPLKIIKFLKRFPFFKKNDEKYRPTISKVKLDKTYIN